VKGGLVVRGVKKKLAENSKIKIGTRKGQIRGMWYQKKPGEKTNIKRVTGERPISGTWY